MIFRRLSGSEITTAIERARINFEQTDPEGTRRLFASLPGPERTLRAVEGGGIRMYGAVENGAVRGVIAMQGTHILMLFTEGCRRGAGIGRVLLKNAESLYPDSPLLVNAAPAAEAFYRRCGFITDPDSEGPGTPMISWPGKKGQQNRAV